jgi:serine/threonine protein kinase
MSDSESASPDESCCCSDCSDCSNEESDGSAAGAQEEEEILNATVYNFPVEVIALERCKQTLDDLMVEDALSDEEWESALMQVVMTLATYQKAFALTHNDLHTNNIMFNETDKKFIYYLFNKKLYKVPTFGRIFKIIDFGRAIYKFNSKLICSDSFHKSGDAATQYNCEPYYNDKKPIIEPNCSFDLCRLGCSLFDFFIDDVDDVETECKKSRLAALVVDWITDDSGRNILYKQSGIDRYPDFKLYKMIARTVHNKIPSQQLLKHAVFTQYEIPQKSVKKSMTVLDIDAIPSYVSSSQLNQ